MAKYELTNKALADLNGILEYTLENWLVTAKKTEDILQLSHIYQEEPILDVGFYTKNYKIMSFMTTIGISQQKSLNPN